jgi:hypothetical protein
VTNVTKHSPRAVISVSINVFIQEKGHFSVTNVVQHSQLSIILCNIGEHIKETSAQCMTDVGLRRREHTRRGAR